MNRTTATARAAAIGCFLATLCLATAASAQTGAAWDQSTQATTKTSFEPIAFPQRDELFGELRATTFGTDDRSFDALSDDEQYTAGMFGVGWDLGRLTVPGLRALVLYSGGGVEQSRFGGQANLDWYRNLFLAAADWGPTFFDTIRPSARLGAGYALQSLDVQTTGPAKHDYAHDFAGFGSLGLEVSTPRQFLGPVRLSLLGEFGYLGQTTATFDELDGSQGGDFSYQQASMGDLSTSGWFWDVGAGVRLEL